MALAQVILRKKIDGLGAEADVVKVRAGYARNFLIPQGKAFEATKANLRHIEALTASRGRREGEELTTAQELAGKIARLRPKFTLEVGQSGKAFGSVTSIDIHKELEGSGIVIDRSKIDLDKPIKKTGKTEVPIKLHADVATVLVVTVNAATPEDAA